MTASCTAARTAATTTCRRIRTPAAVSTPAAAPSISSRAIPRRRSAVTYTVAVSPGERHMQPVGQAPGRVGDDQVVDALGEVGPALGVHGHDGTRTGTRAASAASAAVSVR